MKRCPGISDVGYSSCYNTELHLYKCLFNFIRVRLNSLTPEFSKHTLYSPLIK